MKLDLKGRLLFLWVCFMQLYSTESFTWIVQPANVTFVTKGEDRSLTWKFNLTADEQTKSQTFYFIEWKKFNQTSSDYDLIASTTFLNLVGKPTYDEPRAPHIAIVRSDQATLLIKNIRTEDEGTYKIKYSVQLDGTPIADHHVNVTVLERPEFVGISSDQHTCEHSEVILSCNATGKPAPNITWTRVWENGIDSGELESVDGYHVIPDVSRSSNGTYRCTAFNGVGEHVNQTTTVFVRYSPFVDGVLHSPNTVIEGYPYNLTCNVSGDPLPNISWIKVSNDERTVGRLLQFDNISRNDAGDYKCVASNRCGNDSKTETINVLYKPDKVTLETNTSENTDCSDLWVNFTCISSKANPPVYKYLLFENTTEMNSSQSGSWIKKISKGGKHMYSCMAYQSVKNVRSKDITLTVNVPPSLKQIKNESVARGDSIKVYCNATGFPTPTFMWSKNNTDVSNESALIFKNISTDEAGEYRCTASNTCGNTSLMVYIDVIYKPENVVLRSNPSSNEVCAGVSVNLVCTAEANPPVHSYVLYKNGIVIEGLDNGGTWIERLDTGGNFTYRCEVINSVPGIEESRNLTFTVNVPPSVKQVKNESVEEGDSVKVYCNATGIPTPTFFWTKNNTDVSNESILIFKNISTDEAGEYRCSANNTCGNASIMVYIDVRYSPSITNITGNLTKDEGQVAKLDCEANGNPTPSYTWENVSFKAIGRASSITVQISGKESEGYYTCIANNGIGISASEKVYIFVEHHSPVKTVLTTDVINKTVKINETFRLNCSAEANPPAAYKIYIDTDLLVGNDSITTIVVKEPIERVTFRCEPNNTYGVGPTTNITLKVLFPPYVDTNVTVVKYEGSSVSLPCPARGNPPPSFEWYKGDISNPFQSSRSSLDFSPVTLDADGLYICQATNPLGTAEATVNLIVKRIEKIIPIRCVIEEERNEIEMNEACELCSALACNLSDHCVGKETTSCKRGSIIVDFLLKFSQNVDTNKVLSDLEKAVVEKRFGGLAVDPKSIRQISSSSSTSTTESATTEGTFTKGPKCEETTLKEQNCETKWVTVIVIIIAPVGGSGVVIIIIYHVHKKRKCRKKTRVDNSDGQPLSSNHSTLSCGNPYAEVNSGYAKSGPLPAVDNEQGQGAVGGEAIPTYATVDKSEKKDKKKNKKAAEHESNEDQYAVVDKSKKKKKRKKKRNEQDNTYAEVDMSKKSKKKPGEVLYADLGEFHQMQKMPEVPTSPEPLSPIKMPEAYGETQYADITKFLKGNYEDTGAELPKDSTTPAASNTATDSKEESSAGNTGDGSKATNETGF